MLGSYQEREFRVRQGIQRIERTMAWLERNHKIEDRFRKQLVDDLNHAETYLNAKGDIYFPRLYWLEAAEEKLRFLTGILNVQGWTWDEYNLPTGEWKR